MEVHLQRNIGLLVARLTASVRGRLCKACITRYYWQYFFINLFLGWWGLISFILTPILLISNTVYFIKSRKLSDGLPLPPVGTTLPAGAASPEAPAPSPSATTTP
jgi:hypothetical protein